MLTDNFISDISSKIFLVFLGGIITVIGSCITVILKLGLTKIIKGQDEIQINAKEGRKALHDKIDKNKLETDEQFKDIGYLFSFINERTGKLELCHKINHPDQLTDTKLHGDK